MEYNDVSERCVAPRHDSASATDLRRMSAEARLADFVAEGEFLKRIMQCAERNSKLRRSLEQRAEQFGMNCPKFEWDAECLARFARAKLTVAQNLLLK